MAQQVKPLFVVPAALLPIQLPMTMPGKAGDSPSGTHALATHRRDLDGIPGF